jgi:hypothetical protein
MANRRPKEDPQFFPGTDFSSADGKDGSSLRESSPAGKACARFFVRSGTGVLRRYRRPSRSPRRRSNGHGVLDAHAATRKPTGLSRLPGLYMSRLADRQDLVKLRQEPPHNTRCSPRGGSCSGPCGSTVASALYVSYQSPHHSQTLPCVSYSPHAFGTFCPPGWVFGLVLMCQPARSRSASASPV